MTTFHRTYRVADCGFAEAFRLLTNMHLKFNSRRHGRSRRGRVQLLGFSANRTDYGWSVKCEFAVWQMPTVFNDWPVFAFIDFRKALRHLAKYRVR